MILHFSDGNNEETESIYKACLKCMNMEVMKWACATSASFKFESSSQGACFVKDYSTAFYEYLLHCQLVLL